MKISYDKEVDALYRACPKVRSLTPLTHRR